MYYVLKQSFIEKLFKFDFFSIFTENNSPKIE